MSYADYAGQNDDRPESEYIVENPDEFHDVNVDSDVILIGIHNGFTDITADEGGMQTDIRLEASEAVRLAYRILKLNGVELKC